MIQYLSILYSSLNTFPEYVDEIISNIDNYYTPKKEPKTKYGEYQKDKHGNIRYRDLLVPDARLKRLQRRLDFLLAIRFEFADYVFGAIPGTNHIMNASKHLNHRYFLTVDLKNFFQNITHHQVFEALVENGFSPSVARMITKLTTYKYSLPQGAPTSPFIANLVFQKTASKVFKFVNNHNITFTTFLDDLSFSSNTCFQALVPNILEIIKGDKFYLADSKIHYKRGQTEITGLIVSGSKLKIKTEMLEKAKTNSLLKAYVSYVNKYNKYYRENGFASKTLI